MSDSTPSSDEVLCQILEELRGIRTRLESIDEALHFDDGDGHQFSLSAFSWISLARIVGNLETIREEVVRMVPGIGMISAAAGPAELRLRSIESELSGHMTEGEPSVRDLLKQIASSLSGRSR